MANMKREQMTTYRNADGSPVADEYSFVTDLEYFDDLDEPCEVVEEVWVCQSVKTITVGPKCHCGALATYWGLCEQHAREDDPEHFETKAEA